MKTASAVANSMVSNDGRSVSPTRSRSTTAEPERRSTHDEIVQVWQRLASMYGHKWTSTYGLVVAPLWEKALQLLPVERLKVALGQCIARPDAWPPSLPEFVALARVLPEEAGAPPADTAWREATNRSPHCDWQPWSHRCVYWAAVWTGLTDLSERGQFMRRAFDREYLRALEQADELAEPPRGGYRQKPLPTGSRSAMSRRQISEAPKRVTGKNMENGTVSARINAFEAAGLVDVGSRLMDCPSSGNGVHKVRLIVVVGGNYIGQHESRALAG
ncbi:hypothetical protein ACEK07_04930 [Alcanivoracaceae bacterium MT1]